MWFIIRSNWSSRPCQENQLNLQVSLWSGCYSMRVKRRKLTIEMLVQIGFYFIKSTNEKNKSVQILVPKYSSKIAIKFVLSFWGSSNLFHSVDGGKKLVTSDVFWEETLSQLTCVHIHLGHILMSSWHQGHIYILQKDHLNSKTPNILEVHLIEMTVNLCLP